jgi:excinuclease ABC subunit A
MLFAEDFSPNTAQGACPTCHGLGFTYEVTERSMVPDESLSIRERAIASWPPAWQGQNLRDILVSMGIDVDIPWRELPKKTRDFILYTEEQPTVPVYAGYTPAETRRALKRKEEPSYQGTFMGARKYVLHTFGTTQSALMKKRVSRFMTGSLCPSCQGKRLKREALDVKFAGKDIGELAQLSLTDLGSYCCLPRNSTPRPCRKRNALPRGASPPTSSSASRLCRNSAWATCRCTEIRLRCRRGNCNG